MARMVLFLWLVFSLPVSYTNTARFRTSCPPLDVTLVYWSPVPRLVSAFFYCRKSVDGLCAQNIVKATDIDLTTFARHWGNYGLRQFALAFVLPEAVFSAETDDNCKGDREDNRCSGWYRLKLYLDNLETDQGSRWSEEGQESFSTLAMYNLLKPAQELLNSKYAAVGLLEDWDNTMLLFNPSLELPNFDWPRSFRDIGKKNKNEQFHMEHSEALAMAWTDPEIRKYIALDIILYDFAVSVHDRQIQEYGLASWCFIISWSVTVVANSEISLNILDYVWSWLQTVGRLFLQFLACTFYEGNIFFIRAQFFFSGNIH